MRKTKSGVIHAAAGCRICHAGNAHWFGKNALAVAARHHDTTGHPTWCEQAIIVRYGDFGDEDMAEATEPESIAELTNA